MNTSGTIRSRAGKGRIRALVHRGARSQATPPVARRLKGLADETMCERCGNVYRGKRWLAGTQGERSWPIGFGWTVCPACRQIASQEYFGRVLVRGQRALEEEEAIRARIQSVATRAGFTQPQRRIVSIERRRSEIEVLATSQKLAHRIVSALIHAFGGRASFAWSSEDGALRALWTWEALPVPVPKRARRSRVPARRVGAAAPEVEIRCRSVDLDPAWRDRIERHAGSWAERHPKLTRVHVTLAHGTHHRHGSEEVTVGAYESGRMIRASKRGATMTVALRDALKAFERELSAAREEQRAILKPPGARMVGSVRRIWRDAGYGFIRLDRGREAYFHRDSLHGFPFRALRPGMPVEVELEQGEMGLQASRVFPVGQRDRV